MTERYDRLLAALREVALVNSVFFVVEWDEQVMMPPGGASHRAEQKAWLARTAHTRQTSAEFGDALSEAEVEQSAAPEGSEPRAVLRQARRAYDRAVKLPGSLVEEITRTTAHAHHAWVDARKNNDPAKFAPWLAKIVALKQQQAACLAKPGQAAYDVLVDEFEPGETTAHLDEIFGALRAPLVELVGKVMSSGRKVPSEILARDFDVDAQEALGREAAKALGYDFERGRLDVSVHPFSISLGPGDSRITTRYHANRFSDAFFGVLHETGHALYEQGLPGERYGTPLGEAASLGVHESQSRFWENLVGRSRSFWRFFYPKAQKAFPAALAGVSEDDFVAAVNGIRPSEIRVEADEATYNLHILLRFELEQALMTGALKADDVPAAWSDRLHGLLGVRPATEGRGCLQDVHWSGGSLGYFPTYTLGNLFSAQLFEAAGRDLGDLDASFARGEFAPLREWLREKVHRHGQRYQPQELITLATGAPPSVEPLLAHLRRKAHEYYGV
nr:carboxypeptidase M32 [Deltaproteobacteria bacterium]